VRAVTSQVEVSRPRARSPASLQHTRDTRRYRVLRVRVRRSATTDAARFAPDRV